MRIYPLGTELLHAERLADRWTRRNL